MSSDYIYYYEDVIVNPGDERVVVGDYYFFADTAKEALENAKNNIECMPLKDVDFLDSEPFYDGNCHYVVIVKNKRERKEETVQPYDFADPDVRSALLGKHVKYKDPTGCVQDGLITAFVHNSDDIWRCNISGKIEQTAERLMECWEYCDGSPCGKEVTE